MLPQLDEGIAYLRADIAALRSGAQDAQLAALAVSVAAGDAPLPEPQFAPLLSLWVPKSGTFAEELAKLVDEFEAARQKEETLKAQIEDSDVKEPQKRVRTRPRRRFEEVTEEEKQALARQNAVEMKTEAKTDVKTKPEPKMDVRAKPEPKTEVEEDGEALKSLKAMRKAMLLDVLSKIVSVAKSKDVDPGLFRNAGRTDLTKLQQHVAHGGVWEWQDFADQVYLFCQHVVAVAEQNERQEARRKGVELLHFARTLTETLRKASLKKEAHLLEQVEQEKAEKERAAADKVEPEEPKAEASATEEADAAHQPEGIPPLTPTRVSKRIRRRGSETASPPHPRKRSKGTTSAASASEEVSGSESHDASASEADTKPRGRRPAASPASSTAGDKSSGKRGRPRRRRASVVATRISSRQQKRRAAAAAAAAESTADEENSGADTHQSADEDNDEEETGEEEEHEAPKKKRAAPKPRGRKKGSRKR